MTTKCKGMNCTSTDGHNHSPECQAEHAAAVAGGRFVKSSAPAVDALYARAVANAEETVCLDAGVREYWTPEVLQGPHTNVGYTQDMYPRDERVEVVVISHSDYLRACNTLLAHSSEAAAGEPVACPQCGGSLTTWKCTCEPMWRGYTGSTVKTTQSEFAFIVDPRQRIDDVLPADRRWVISKGIGLVAAYRNCADSETKEVMQQFVDYMRAALADSAASGKKLPDPAVEAFIDEVRAELMRARAKFPGDRIMTIALAEEFGELCKAVLDEGAANVRKEAVQTAVMCARVVLDGDSSVNDWRAEKGLDPLVERANG